jgi:hypothetical protein
MAEPKKKRSLITTLAMIATLVFLLMLGSCVGMWAYGKSVPEAHTASGSEIIKADIDDVFAMQADVQKHPEWHNVVAEVQDYKEDEDGTATWLAVWKDGNNRFRMKRTAQVENQLIRVEIADEAEFFSGSWTFNFEEVEGGTKVTITEDGRIPNAFFRGMYTLTSEPDQTLKEHLKHWKAEAEKRAAQ